MATHRIYTYYHPQRTLIKYTTDTKQDPQHAIYQEFQNLIFNPTLFTISTLSTHLTTCNAHILILESPYFGYFTTILQIKTIWLKGNYCKIPTKLTVLQSPHQKPTQDNKYTMLREKLFKMDTTSLSKSIILFNNQQHLVLIWSSCNAHLCNLRIPGFYGFPLDSPITIVWSHGIFCNIPINVNLYAAPHQTTKSRKKSTPMQHKMTSFSNFDIQFQFHRNKISISKYPFKNFHNQIKFKFFAI